MVAWKLLETQLLPSLGVHWQDCARPSSGLLINSGGQPPQASVPGRRKALSGALFPVRRLGRGQSRVVGKQKPVSLPQW